MSSKIDIKNKKAKFEFEFLETYTAGLQLYGTEIKSIRNNKASITEAYAVMIKNELFLRNMYIADYENGSHYNHESKRDRKLLLNKIYRILINKEELPSSAKRNIIMKRATYIDKVYSQAIKKFNKQKNK